MQQQSVKIIFFYKRLKIMLFSHGDELKATYVDTLKRDSGARDAAELATLMRDRGIWHGHVVGRRQATK